MATNSPYTLVIHGGAGSITNEVIAQEKQRQATHALREALTLGHSMLSEGASSVECVEATIMVLEDCPVFNAGKGAAFTHEGTIELDAAIMDGKTRKAGAVAAVTGVKNPITAARAVMERSAHVLLVGHGADRFAVEMGLTIVDSSYFWTQERWDQLQRELKGQKPHAFEMPDGRSPEALERKHGTVGAVALDKAGNLAAATSTGGISFQKFGRVGDSPIIGAGTYAENATCAMSATGEGEYFMRLVLGHELSSLMKYKGLSLEQAAAEVIHSQLSSAGGEGGIIALNAKGEIAIEFNTQGMYRGYIQADGKPVVSIFRE